MPDLATQRHDRALTEGVVAGWEGDILILALPGTDYRLHLYVGKDLAGQRLPLDAPIRGVIRLRARRVDVVPSGGRFIEPVYGRPRRIQGMIVQAGQTGNTITVQCVCPWVCKLMAGQKAGEFTEGQLVAFDVESGTTFTPLPLDVMERAQARPHGVTDNHSDPTPAGHAPPEGRQGPMHETIPGRVLRDQGALNSAREITGMEAPPADFPLSEVAGGAAHGRKKHRATVPVKPEQESG